MKLKSSKSDSPGSILDRISHPLLVLIACGALLTSPCEAFPHARTVSCDSGKGISYIVADYNVTATQRSDSLYWLPEIIVSARRAKGIDEPFCRSGFVAALDLAKQKGHVNDLPALLSSVVGVKVRQYGGLGSFATVSIRGSSSSQVQVYLDGVPLNDPYMGLTDLSDLPLSGISRIEVYRGFSPTDIGSSAIGGVINLKTESNDEEDYRGKGYLSATSSLGSFDTKRYSLEVRSHLRGLSLGVNASYTGSNGDFPFIDDRATPENPLDDVETIRLNNDFTILNLLAAGHTEIAGKLQLSLTHFFSRKEGGVPGIASYQSTRARAERTRNISYLKVKSNGLAVGKLRFSLTAFENGTSDKFSDPEGDITSLRQDTDNKIATLGANAYLGCTFTSIPISLKLFNELKKERYHPVSYIPSPSEGPDRLRRSYQISAGTETFLFNESLIVSFNEKYEWHENEFYNEPRFPWLPPTPQGKVVQSTWSPHLGIRVRLSDFLTIKGNIGKYHRLPTFLELFGNLGSVTGSSELQPEEGINRDAGLIISRERVSFIKKPYLELVYMDNDVDNLILFFPNSQYTSKPVNIGRASIRGAELSVSGSFANILRLSGNYTYLDSRDTSPIPYYNGKRLAGRPVHDGFVSVEVPARWLKLSYELHYIGANYLDRANMKEVPARRLHNASISLDAKERGVELTIEVRNFTDNRVSDVSGFPLPGRSFYASLQIRL